MRKREIVFAVEELLAPSDALARFFSRVTIEPPAIEEVTLDQAAGRVLARRIDADADYPGAARSAMDGFALDAAATPGSFQIAGDIRMGAAGGELLERGSAMRIPTGGIVPSGANAVVPIENVRVVGRRIEVDVAVERGEDVIERGADMRRGEVLLQPGCRIAAPQVALLATLGIVGVPVYEQPTVAVISSGDELIEPAAALRTGAVRDSNRYGIAAALRAIGARVHHGPILPDEFGVVKTALAEAIGECDAVVLTGGTSVGARDHLPAAVAELGKPGLIVHGLRMKPGKPAFLGAVGRTPIVGLPGNPASALFVLEAIGVPVMGALTGGGDPARSLVARLAAPARGRSGWTSYVPVALRQDEGLPLAHPLPMRSFSVSLTARAGGYLVLAPPEEELAAGTIVTVRRFLGG